MRRALTVAGVDSGGGAGVTADLKTFDAHDVWGMAAVTAVTAQNTVGVQQVRVLPAGLVRAQIESVVSDIGVDAVKTGMLGTRAVVTAVARAAPKDVPLVVDPVLQSSTGASLLNQDALDALRRLIARATVVTPNSIEAAALTGVEVSGHQAMQEAGAALVAMGAQVAMVTGGHVVGTADDVVTDCVVSAERASWLVGPRVDTTNAHGSGCVLSAAIAAELARGMDPEDACVAAKRFVEHALAAGVPLGAGGGAANPSWAQ